jgi:hypothetical protein
MGGGGPAARRREDGEGGGGPITRCGHEDEGERGEGEVWQQRGSALLDGSGGEQREGAERWKAATRQEGEAGPGATAAARNDRQAGAGGMWSREIGEARLPTVGSGHSGRRRGSNGLNRSSSNRSKQIQMFPNFD